MLQQYYYLTKPGIIRGNLLTALGGFFLASAGDFDWWRLVFLLVGMAMVIGASCVFNNIYDRDIDKRMQRTRKRATVSGEISLRSALLFGLVLAVVGTGVLIWKVNVLTAVLGLFGLVTYVGAYTPAKHRTPYATLIGTIPGAVPPVAGYAAVLDRLDGTCLLLFFILIAWQMPHFYAIAIRRLSEYKAAKVPVWPAVRSVRQTKQQIIIYMPVFIFCALALSASGKASWLFGGIMGAYGLYWLYGGLRGYNSGDDTNWAKKVFLMSLPILPLFSLLLAIDSLLA
jgi:protoheme IX farnesyltransferase